MRMRFIGVRQLAVAMLTLLVGGCSGPVLSTHPLYTGRDLVSKPDLSGHWVEFKGSTNAEYAFVPAGRPVTAEASGISGQSETTRHEVYTIVRLNAQGRYRVTVPCDEPDVTTNLVITAHLLRLDGQLFLDLLLDVRSWAETFGRKETSSSPPAGKLDKQERKAKKSQDREAALEGKRKWPWRRVHYWLRVLRTEPQLELVSLDANWVKDALGDPSRTVAHRIVDTGLSDMVMLTAPTLDLQRFVRAALKDQDAWEKRVVVMPQADHAQRLSLRTNSAPADVNPGRWEPTSVQRQDRSR